MQDLVTKDYFYDLPQDRIALHPLPERDQSKLLVFKKGISHHVFNELPALLPANTFLFFNDTKVIPARLHFKKETGAEIEIFLLNPVKPSTLMVEAMAATDTCVWACTIGNLKRWREDVPLIKKTNAFELQAKLIDKSQGLVQFSWTPAKSFAEIISESGETPLPPYLNRPSEESDRERYQTIYSHYEGAVAAPTAGLHFTEAVFKNLHKKNIGHDFLTLHVSAGTFQPIKTDNASEHLMHREQIIVSRRNIENLLTPNRFVIPVGTTSMRTLESIYWYGNKLLHEPGAPFNIDQDDPYISTRTASKQETLRAVLQRMDHQKTDMIIGSTSIFIRPGYSFKICDALITNFHQPASTLILLVAALVGPAWREIYDQALSHNYRFLSYGDSSLLFPAK